MTMRHWRSRLLLVLLTPALTLAADPTPGKASPVVEVKQPALSELARSLLKQRMQSHAREVTELMYAVLLLDHDTAADAAQNIAKEPRLAKEGAEADTMNRSIPPLFFKLQDELRTRALAVNAAAVARDSKALSLASGAMMETCVRCHAAFLSPQDAAHAIEHLHMH